MESHFLHAEWNNLILANYIVSPQLILPYMASKIELDYFEGNAYISLVGFMFLNTKIRGFGVPYHINFEELNLRFYVKHKENGNWIRGVSFIKGIVPKPAISLIANSLFGEKYVTMKIKHSHYESDAGLETEYHWRYKKEWNKLPVTSLKKSSLMRSGSEEEFIAEHYWGFTKASTGKTIAYEVQHPRWEIFHVTGYTIDCNFTALYGEKFSFLHGAKPSSIFMAKGSEVKIFPKKVF